jgi:hypothetical protein
MNVRAMAIALALPALLVPAASAGADPSTSPLTATVHISVTIVGSATIGAETGAAGRRYYVRGSDDRDLGVSEVRIVFRDGRGERELRDTSAIQPAIVAAQRAGDDHVDVTFVL